MTNKVILIGTDQGLVRSRAMVLRSLGYEVTWGLDLRPPELLQANAYDLLLVCSSVPQNDASGLIAQARRRCPKMYILRLVHRSGSPGIDTDLADDTIVPELHPQSWLDAIHRMLGSHQLSGTVR